MSNSYKFEYLWSENQWLENVYLTANDDGTITKITDLPEQEDYQNVPGITLPGVPNSHSHAFQYTMAGLAEGISNHSNADIKDNFWSWRKTMYDLALHLKPEDIESIATKLYFEMLKNGYTSVAEFHYLHHKPDGNLYENNIEISQSLIRAAQNTGIKLTLVPVYYNTFSFEQAASPEQRRFIFKQPECFISFLSQLEKSIPTYNYKKQTINLGFGAHSLRAAPIEHIKDILSFSTTKPFHIHIAEQMGEVNECIEKKLARPVEYLHNKLPVDTRFHLVHATHITDKEISLIHNSQANVVICPSTEANLGDGIFPLTDFWDHKNNLGRWSIGSDSHVSLNPFEEFRLLEYSQRLKTQTRNTICQKPGDESGDLLFQSAITNGSLSVASNSLRIENSKQNLSVGSPLDSITFALDHPFLQFSEKRKWLSLLIFSNMNLKPQEVRVNGQVVFTPSSEQLVKKDLLIEEKLRNTLKKIYS